MPSVVHLVENVSVPTDPRVWPECIALRDAGWDVTVVCPRGTGSESAVRDRLENIDIWRYDASRGHGFAGYIVEYGSALRKMSSLLRHSVTGTFDVVHAASPPDVLLLAARRKRRLGAVTVLDHHDLSPELYEVKFGRKGAVHRSLLLAERLGMRLADIVIAPNESFRRVAIERGRKSAHDVFIVRNGPDPDVFRPVPPDPSLAHGARHLIGFVGRMERQDGVLEALDVLAELRRIRSDWHAVFVGDGEMLRTAKQRVATGDLEGHVTFAGFVSDRERLVEIISTCAVCISPEPKNALNDQSTLIKVAEYMAAERPVVAFDLIETRRTTQGAAICVEDRDEFARAISYLLDDPDERAEMGRRGRRRIIDELGWQRSRSALLAAYDRALDIRRRRGPAQSTRSRHSAK
jgi:glycosyltransferase involved in cell wall biosynthesis